MQIRSLVAVALLAGCDAGTPDPGPDAATPADHGGTFHDQPIVVGGETRYFYLHVPASAVGHPAPLLVDFHGTGFVVRPEEEWGLAEMEAASDELGFIVARPRSHSFDFQGTTLYQWDLDAADLAGTLALATQLIDAVDARYAVARERVYTAGFSNGTNMALQTLAIPGMPFHGVGIVGGGIYYPFTVASWPDPAPRIWATSGYRDVNYTFQRDMTRWLADNHYPVAALHIRETEAMHELRGWHYREMFAWLDAGTTMPEGALGAGWHTEAFPAATTLLTATRGAGDRVIATGADGSVWVRGSAGWTAANTSPSGQPVLVGACLTGTGGGYATGEAANLTTTDDGATWQLGPRIPAFGSAFGSSALLTVECGPGAHLVGGGPGLSAVSADAGATWTSANMRTVAGAENVVHAVRRGASGVWVAAGLGYVGRSTDGATFTPGDIGFETYLYDVAEAGPGRWWAVGVDGAMLRSIDDGATWQSVPPVAGDALFAIRFASPLVGAAVGLHGTAIVTHDGGATWQLRHAGIDRMLGDLVWLDAGHALVVGERGTVLTLEP